MNEKVSDFPYYLPSRKEKFIGRTKELQDIGQKFKNEQAQINCICSFSGTRNERIFSICF